MILGRIAVNLVKTQTLGWAGRASLLCSGAGVAPEPSKHKENQKQGGSAVSP